MGCELTITGADATTGELACIGAEAATGAELRVFTLFKISLFVTLPSWPVPGKVSNSLILIPS